MKKLITILVLSSAMLSACEGDPEFVPKTSVEAKIHELMIGYDGKIDMAVFIADAQRGVWLIDDIDITYTNGKTESGVMDGAALMNSMMLLPTGICRTFFTLMHIPGPTVYSEGDQWSVSGEMKNTLALYNPGIIKGQCILHFTADTPLIAFRIYRRAGNMHKRKECTAYTSGKKHHAIHESRSVHNATLGFSIRIGYIDVVNQPDTPLCVRYEYGHIDFSIVTDHQFVDFRLHRSFRNKLGITFACRQHRRRQD